MKTGKSTVQSETVRALARACRRGALPLVGVVAACSAGATSPGSDNAATTEQAATGACATPVIPGQSLFVAPVVSTYAGAGGGVTNTPNPFGVAALKNFSFEAVMEQIVTSGGVTVPGGAEIAALALYQQLLSTLGAPACTGTVNGFPVDCPSESKGATTNPFNGGANGIPPALVNRFDLAPNNGANCGEYRVVFGVKAPTFATHFLMIFEATLPNPKPSAGLAACLPVAQFWDSLSAPGITAASFASKLQSFYFDGLPGFAPVIQAQNYGIGAPANTNTGQIRVNMQALGTAVPNGGDVVGNWEPGQFELSQQCPKGATTGCTLTAVNTFVANNPFPGLFAPVGDGGPGDGSQAFQTEFLSQVKALAATSIPVISMSTPNADNAGLSEESNDTQGL